MKKYVYMLVTGAAFVAAAVSVFACDGCKAALASKANVPHFGEGMGYSIYFMLAMPFLILGGFSSLLWWKVREARKQPSVKNPQV